MRELLERAQWWGIAVGVALMLGAGPGVAAGNPATARWRLAEAKKAAAQWQKDAVLVTVTSLQTAPDGTAPLNIGGWVYTFHSKKAKAWAGFHATPQGLERVDLPAGLTDPLPAEFVDSPAALAEARKHGLQQQGDVLLVLMFQRDPNLKPGLYWCAAAEADVSAEQGMRGYCVDPTTGKFVARMAGGALKPAQEKPSPTAGGPLAGFDPAQCGGFSAADAAAVLGVPAGTLTRSVERPGQDQWVCRFAGAGGKQVVFRLQVAKTPAEAAAGFAQYVKSLNDEYSDLMGLGDEGVWTEGHRAATFRKQNVTVQVQQPPEKIPQLKVVQALFGRP